MNLVVDTNILISFFRENPVRYILINSKELCLDLFCPEKAFEELLNKKKDLIKYSKKSEEQLTEEISLLKNLIKIIPKHDFSKFEEDATKLIHDKDIPFFALSLHLEIPIWSNEPSFKRQTKVHVFNTREIIELLF